MSTPTRTPRKAAAPKRDRQDQGVIVAPEKVDDPKAERVLWDLASKIEGLGGIKSVGGNWLENPLKWPEGFVIEIDKWRTRSPIRWKVYEESKRTHGKGIEFWLNDEKVIDAENNITASMVDHGGLGGLTDDDHTQYARTDGSRAITGTQVFNQDIKLKPTKRIYFDDTTLTSYIAEAADDVIRISTASTAVADFDSTGLQLQQNLKWLSGTSFSGTLDHANTANRTYTCPDADFTLAGRNIANTFTADQTFDAGLASNTVAERTAAAGVTVDGVLLKDGGLTLADNLSIAVLKTIDGRDVSVDGAKLDTIETGATADQTAAEILAALLTVDGAGSGLDADLLDGLSSLAFLKANGSVVSTGQQDFDAGLRLRAAGAGNYATLARGADVTKTITMPSATSTLPGLGLANTFTALQTFETTSGTAVQIGTTNTSSDMVVGELTGATGYVAIGLQGSLTFGTGANAQANLYTSATDTILYINNRLNSNISFRINNVDAMIIAGSNRNIGVGVGPNNNAVFTVSGALLGARSSMMVGTNYGSGTAPAAADFSILLYRADANNWAGLSGDGSGHIMFRAGTSGTPNARFTIGSDGYLYVSATTTKIGDQSGNLYQQGTIVTSSAAELNILDGVTATAAELNIMDGVTLTTAQINNAAIKNEVNTFGANQIFPAITISSAFPAIAFTDTTASEDDWQIVVNGSVFKLQNVTQVRDDLSFDTTGAATFGGPVYGGANNSFAFVVSTGGGAGLLFGTGTPASYTQRLRVDGATGDIGIASGNKLGLDGVSVGNTYLTEAAADVLTLVAGGKTTDFDYGLGKIDTQLGFRFQDGQASLGGIFALDTITTGDKTYTFPDASGNVSLQGVSTWVFVSENTSIDTTSASYVEVAIASTAWPGASFSKLREAYFEAVIGEATTGVARCQLYNATSAAEITVVSTEAVGPVRVRSANIASSLTDNFNIQVRIKNDTAGQATALWVARLILVW